MASHQSPNQSPKQSPSPASASLSTRVAGIAESATLAVDAKAKALQAEG